MLRACYMSRKWEWNVFSSKLQQLAFSQCLSLYVWWTVNLPKHHVNKTLVSVDTRIHAGHSGKGSWGIGIRWIQNRGRSHVSKWMHVAASTEVTLELLALTVPSMSLKQTKLYQTCKSTKWISLGSRPLLVVKDKRLDDVLQIVTSGPFSMKNSSKGNIDLGKKKTFK